MNLRGRTLAHDRTDRSFPQRFNFDRLRIAIQRGLVNERDSRPASATPSQIAPDPNVNLICLSAGNQNRSQILATDREADFHVHIFAVHCPRVEDAFRFISREFVDECVYCRS